MSLKVAIFLKEVITIWVQLRELETRHQDWKKRCFTFLVSFLVALCYLCCLASFWCWTYDLHWFSNDIHTTSHWPTAQGRYCSWCSARSHYHSTNKFCSLSPYFHCRQKIWSQRGDKERGSYRQENSSSCLHQFNFLYVSRSVWYLWT